jgi:uncharacterized cupredoxin-like copper-binding protein
LRTHMKALLAIAVLALSLSAAAGCGSSDKKSSSSTTTSTTGTTSTPATKPSAGGSTLTTDADPGGALKFTKTTLTAKAGKVTLTMKNPSSTEHGIGVKGNGAQQVGNSVGQGGVSTVTANLKPGKYEFYCPVDGHEQAGMKGTLTVK